MSDDALNCGACGAVCEATGTNVEGACVEGACEARCTLGFGDCNRDLPSDPSHCGVCGEEPACRFFPMEAQRPVAPKLVAGSDGFMIVWLDFIDEGLWVARLDARGQQAQAPYRVWDAKSWWRYDLVYSGGFYSLVWEDEQTEQLMGLRFDQQGAPVGAPLVLAQEVEINSIQILGGEARTILLYGDRMSDWPHDASEPPSSMALPGSSHLSVAGARVADGYILLWGAEYSLPQSNATRTTIETLRLDASGAPIGSPAELDGGLDLSLGGYFSIVEAGEGALLSVENGFPNRGWLELLSFDRSGRPQGGASPVWRTPSQSLWSSSFVSSGAETLWAVGARPEDGRFALRAQRVSALGEPVAEPVWVANARLGTVRLTAASSAQGLMMMWGWRSQSGGPDLFAMEGTFLSRDGDVRRPCP